MIRPPAPLSHDAEVTAVVAPSFVAVAVNTIGLPLLVAPPCGVALVTCGEPALLRNRKVWLTSLKPVMAKPPPLLGRLAVPPGIVALYAALVATLFGTTAWTATSCGCAIGAPATVAMHGTWAHVI